MEIITGVERRRRWSVEEKLRIVAETEQPGFGIAEVGFKGERGYAPELRGQKEFSTSSSEPCPRPRPCFGGRPDSGVLRALCGRGAGGKLRFQKA